MLTGYFNRFDPAQEYDEHLFRAGGVLQGAELNEIQSALIYRTRSIGDALFKDGDIVRDARVVITPGAETGIVRCESGAIYLAGMVRGVPPATVSVPMVGLVAIGIYLVTSIVTELEDYGLRDPAAMLINYQEPGAARRKVSASWGTSATAQEGEFFPIYTVEDGYLIAKEAPPNLDAFVQGLARYDRDSAGGSYVVSGLDVKRMDDLQTGQQVYTVSEGRARVNGYGIEQPTSRRLVFPSSPDLRMIASEPHFSSTASAQRVLSDRAPINDITAVSITRERVVAITHGGFIGAHDVLPDTSVLQIMSVTQGATTYANPADFKLTGGKVDWSATGNEPATGSTYTVRYQFIAAVVPTLLDATGFTVTGAVPGTLILVSYNQRLPRIDRLALNADGSYAWIKGVSADWNPRPPSVPKNMLSLASVYQLWMPSSRVINDSVRVVPMPELSQINGRIDYMLGLIAQQRLESSANLKEAVQKKGLFVDPFLDDSLRDAGLAQTAAIFGGELNLAIDVLIVAQMSGDIVAPLTLPFVLEQSLAQTSYTGSMLINPYMAFDPIPAKVVLSPAIDQWTEINTTWASPITNRFTVTGTAGSQQETTSSSVSTLLSSTSRPAELLRRIDVRFVISGFGPNEALSSVLFDGISVVST